MTDLLIVAVLLFIVGVAAAYIIKAKKSGQKCIGCPNGTSCGKSECHCGCGGHTDE